MKRTSTITENRPVRPLFSKTSRTLICFSHLRWDFVYQRPQHLLTRFATQHQVIFIEEPMYVADTDDHYEYRSHSKNLTIVVPHLLEGRSADENIAVQKKLFDQFIMFHALAAPIFWYYTPMALEFTRKYQAEITVFDCMDELAAFRFAPENLKALEQELFSRADIVFTGGHAIYEAKKSRHSNIYSFPSSVDTAHFGKTRKLLKEGNAVTLGYFGVIDERFDAELIGQMAKLRPDWQFQIIGPVVKIDPATLPDEANIHYPGIKSYQALPAALANWDIALIPFLINESTRYISPTKTPEYLAAGKPVISTPIRDVINPYGKEQLVYIAHDAAGFIAAAEMELKKTTRSQWLNRVDVHLSLKSWDRIVGQMENLIEEAIENKTHANAASSL